MRLCHSHVPYSGQHPMGRAALHLFGPCFLFAHKRAYMYSHDPAYETIQICFRAGVPVL